MISLSSASESLMSKSLLVNSTSTKKCSNSTSNLTYSVSHLNNHSNHQNNHQEQSIIMINTSLLSIQKNSTKNNTLKILIYSPISYKIKNQKKIKKLKKIKHSSNSSIQKDKKSSKHNKINSPKINTHTDLQATIKMYSKIYNKNSFKSSYSTQKMSH